MIVPGGYHSGGASYVLSREALRRFYQAHQDRNTSCLKDGGSEDIQIAKCLRRKGVYIGKSLDKQNRELFHPVPFSVYFSGKFPKWLLSYAANPLQAVSNRFVYLTYEHISSFFSLLYISELQLLQ